MWLLLDDEFRWRDRGLTLEHDFGRDLFSAVDAPAEQTNERRRPVREPQREVLTREPSFDQGPLLNLWVEHHLPWFAAAVLAFAYWLI